MRRSSNDRPHRRDRVIASVARRWRRLFQPRLESHLAELGLAGGDQRSLAELGAEVPRVRVDDDRARVVARGETLTNQIVEAELFGTSYFKGAVHRGTGGDADDRAGNIVSGHWLNEDRRHSNRPSVCRFIGDALHELEELRG